jgi:aspartyl/asparaginyl beta-hydroxylase (cupin superfamily)
MQHISIEPAVFGLYFKEENYYTGSMPRYYDSSDFPWIKGIEEKWEIMRDEITGYLKSGDDLKGFTSPMSPGLSYPKAWKKIYFMNMLWLQFGNCRKLPITWGILKQIPGITLGAVLILEPKGHILPHVSESNINIRCHLGIKIPASLPKCGMRVGNEDRGWEEGKVLMFSDCYEHTAWNDSNEIRIIVAFDVLQKQYDGQRTWRCAQYLGALTLRSLDVYIPFRKKVPALLLKAIHNSISLFWFIYLPIQAKLEWLLA